MVIMIIMIIIILILNNNNNNNNNIKDERMKELERNNLLLKDFKMKLKIIYNIALGVRHLHRLSPPIIHRDLRSPNIFITNLDNIESNDIAKVGDFGLSRLNSSSLAGGEFNVNWLAPEVMQNFDYSLKIDIYSFAIIMWEILTLKKPFEEFDEIFAGKPKSIFRNAVINGLRPSIGQEFFDSEKNGNFSVIGYVDLIKECWQADPLLRPSFDVIVDKIKFMLIENNVPFIDPDNNINNNYNNNNNENDNLNNNNNNNNNNGVMRRDQRKYFDPNDRENISNRKLVCSIHLANDFVADVNKFLFCQDKNYGKVWVASSDGRLSLLSLVLFFSSFIFYFIFIFIFIFILFLFYYFYYYLFIYLLHLFYSFIFFVYFYCEIFCSFFIIFI